MSNPRDRTIRSLRSSDTLDDLTARGDAALYEAKRRKQAERSRRRFLRRAIT
jgi:hypothetical protein